MKESQNNWRELRKLKKKNRLPELIDNFFVIATDTQF